MPRLFFEKTGNAVWISHLDLMRLFQRAFKRAGLALKHSQGYNPRPMVSIALPLSVGVESRCELLDFELEGISVPFDEIKNRLNDVLVEGIHVLEVFQTGGKLKDLLYLQCSVFLEYDHAVCEDLLASIQSLFCQPSLVVEKKSKKGNTTQDIIPMIKNVEVGVTGENTVVLQARICCQNPSLNPMQLAAAVCSQQPQMIPSHIYLIREEIYDANGNVFR